MIPVLSTSLASGLGAVTVRFSVMTCSHVTRRATKVMWYVRTDGFRSGWEIALRWQTSGTRPFLFLHIAIQKDANRDLMSLQEHSRNAAPMHITCLKPRKHHLLLLLLYDLFTGPLTPAPITLGSSSSPMLHTCPTAKLTRPTSPTVNKAISQNCTLTSFFWHAGPPQYVVLTRPLPSSFVVALHWQA